jgi:hypothetical protein
MSASRQPIIRDPVYTVSHHPGDALLLVSKKGGGPMEYLQYLPFLVLTAFVGLAVSVVVGRARSKE